MRQGSLEEETREGKKKNKGGKQRRKI